jgi:5-methylcytosine-specific restriction endonuclease McrA
MPIDYKNYPENWKWLSKQIIKDAGNRCELCYAPNCASIARDKDNLYPWYYPAPWEDKKRTTVVLTVHHIDSNKQNSKKQNLIALCQRCHLRLDLQKHMANRAKKRITNEHIQLSKM